MAIITGISDCNDSENLASPETNKPLQDTQKSLTTAAQLNDAVYGFCYVVYALCNAGTCELPDNVRLLSTFSHTKRNAA